MSATIPFFILIGLVHMGIFLTSLHADRLKRLMMALLITAFSIPMVLLGIRLGLQADSPTVMVILLNNSPYVISLLAFLAYVRRWHLPG